MTSKLTYQREPVLKTKEIIIGRPDFVVEDKIIVDLKAKKFIITNKHLGLIVNFCSAYLKPKRILNNRFNSNHSRVN